MAREFITDENGKNYIKANKLDGFRYEVKRNDKVRNGYGYPFDFRINAWSKDETALFTYFCPLHYIDDDQYLPNPKNEFKYDEYGRKLRTFMKVDDFVQQWFKDFIDKYKPTLVKKFYPMIDNVDQKERQQKEYDQLVAKKHSGETIDSHYHWAVIYIYAYEKNGYKRRKAIECEVYGTKKTLYQACDMRLYSPISMDLFHMAYPKTVTGSDGKLYSPFNTYRIWSVSRMGALDCLEKDFDNYYQYFYNELFTWDDCWAKTLIEETNQLQSKLDEEYKRKREAKAQERAEQRRIAEDERRRAEEKRESDRRFYENLRKTQQETHDIWKQAHENSKKAHDRAFEQWSDTFNDRTRFVDKYGDEHVIRTFDNYAYKSGDTYVTSDYDRGDILGWERLEKKKY